MHGPTSGHLVVHCNSKIILIDFSILEDKTYSFFIEEELCELSIERKGDQFFYGFKTNAKVDTPLNQARKKQSRKYLYQSLAFVAFLLVAVSIGSLTMHYLNADYDRLTLEQQLSKMGKETHARIMLSPDGKGKQVEYFFTVNGKPYTVETPFDQSEQPLLLETGMPLEVGDEFLLQYLPDNPLLHSISYDSPSAGTLESYRKRALAAYQEQHPEQSDDFSRCLTEVAFESEGIKGLAMVYFAKTQEAENKLFNKKAFKEWIDSHDFKMAMAAKCNF